MERAYQDLASLLTDVHKLRRQEGVHISPYNDAKRRRFGFGVTEGDDWTFLYVPGHALSGESLQALNEAQATDQAALPTNLWDEGSERDMVEDFMWLTDEEREAERVRQGLPTADEMAGWVQAIEHGISNADPCVWKDTGCRTFPGSPFTFRWTVGNPRRHHVLAELRTDAQGITVSLRQELGGGEFSSARLPWKEQTQATVSAWVQHQAQEVTRRYLQSPVCLCEYHRQWGMGLIK